MALGFWTLPAPADAPAVVADDGRAIPYGELRERADRVADALAGPAKSLVFVLCRNTPESLTAYLGALRSGQAVCLLDAELGSELLGRLVDTYTPEWIISGTPLDLTGYEAREGADGVIHRRVAPAAGAIAEPLALLLPTSGSTGSPKMVRLSYANLQANACSIVDYLGITPDDRCITSLPMAYSYGLSVLHTHLLRGATILMTTSSFLQRDFWNFLRAQRPTSLAGVPYHYETMLRMRMLQGELPGVHTLTQAGGRLAPERIAQVASIAAARGWRFFVMYGQTEATARISYVPAERLNEKVGSIGIPIRDGSLELNPETQELMYAGPNVMLGYAEGRADLAKGDEVGGALATGDLARRDQDGYYYIVGRLKRFLKIFGKRFSLDEMEALIGRHVGHEVACVGVDDRVSVAIAPATDREDVARVLTSLLGLHPTAFRITSVDELPRLASGKRDYQALGRMVGLS